MDDGVEIIHQYPLRIVRPFRVRRHGVHFFLHFFVNAVGNGLDVRIGIALANDKEISRRVAKFPEVELDDIFAFFVPDTLDNEVIELFGVCLAGFCPPGCCGCNQDADFVDD